MKTAVSARDILSHVNDFGRNGVSAWMQHPLMRRFLVSTGVYDMAQECGLHWLTDILATETHKLCLSNPGYLGIVYFSAENGEANIRLEFEDNVTAWSRHVEFTDCPDVLFNLCVTSDDGVSTVCLFISER